MPYVTLSDLCAVIPPVFLTQALDDDGDGQADAGLFDAIAAEASGDVDALLGQRYPSPFVSPYPAVVATAARIFACEMLYARRGNEGDKNPWKSRADDQRAKLEAIAEGKQPLFPGQERALPSVSAIVERAKTTPETGLLTT